MIGLSLLVALAAQAPATAPVVRTQEVPPKKRVVSLADDFVSVSRMSVVEALLVDPNRLARAAPGAWKDFDPARITDRASIALLDMARRDILRGNFHGALCSTLTLLRRQPDFPPALHMSGILYYRLQRYGDSAVTLRRYLEVAPTRVGDTRVLGHDLYTLGRYGEARAHYELVLAAAPDDVEARRGLALSVWRAGDAARALSELDAVLAREPRNDEAWGWKAQILFDAGDDVAALEAARRASELDPSDPRTWFLLARLHAEAGRDEEAASAEARFAELSAKVQALRVAERALLQSPDDVARAVDVLECQRRLGDRRRLSAGLEQLRAFGSDACAVHRATLDALLDLGRAAEGAPVAKALRRCVREELDGWRALARYYAVAGDATDAAYAAERVRALEGR